MPHPFFQVDAFTDRPFAGNPAAVFALDRPADATWMQLVAREMNLAETAFLVRRDGHESFDLRWFTPTVEVDLCGHATLASAHVLWQSYGIDAGRALRFHTRSGELGARRTEDGWIELDFPATPPHDIDEPAGLTQALGAPLVRVMQTKFDLFVELDSERAVRALKPDLSRLIRFDVRGVIVTSRADDSPEFDFVSRFFCPQVGVDEDPVTGSAHASLGPYWSALLGKPHLVAYQASARGGVVRVETLADRVLLAGQAVTVFRGEMF